jgi:large subunit ribosomal protein L40e
MIILSLYIFCIYSYLCISNYLIYIAKRWHTRVILSSLTQQILIEFSICYYQPKFVQKIERKKSTIPVIRSIMPITDAVKKQIAQQHRLFFKICFRCGARNPISSTRCRKCHSHRMRLKNRTLGVKKWFLFLFACMRVLYGLRRW